MRTPQRWMDACPQGTESQLMQSLLQEPLPEGALLRAGLRLGVTGAILHGTAAAAASTVAANAVTAGTAASAASTLGAAGSTVALTVTLIKALTLGLGIGAVIVGVARGVDPGAPESPRTASQAQALRSGVTTSRRTDLGVTTEAPSPLGSIAQPPPPKLHQAAPNATTAPTGLTARNHEPDASPPSLSPALARFTDLPEPAPASQAVDKDSVQPMTVPVAANVTAPSRSSLVLEVRALDSARTALDVGDAEKALLILQRAERHQTFQTLDREAKVLRVEALSKIGRNAEAERLARALLHQGVSPAQRNVLEPVASPKKQ